MSARTVARPGPPIFVVGSPRSGTTLLRRILNSHPNIACGPETQFLTDLVTIERNHWERLQRFGIDHAEWRERVKTLFTWPHEQFAAQTGKNRWADKTPGYALILDFIDEMFPDCQVVHVVRDGRDVVASWTARWGNRSAPLAVATWSSHVTSAREFGRSRGEARYIEVRYEDLVDEPRPVVGNLLEFLGEPWSDSVLRFGEFAHHLGGNLTQDEARDRARTVDRQVGDPSAIYRPEGSRKNRPDHALQRLLLRRRAGTLLRELGYG